MSTRYRFTEVIRRCYVDVMFTRRALAQTYESRMREFYMVGRHEQDCSMRLRRVANGADVTALCRTPFDYRQRVTSGRESLMAAPMSVR